MTGTPKRAENAAMSGADDSGASTYFRWWSRSRGGRRCREDVRERAPDGAEERRAVVLHVGEEARRGESAAQQQRGARTANDGNTLAASAWPWNIGIAQ